MPYVSKWIRDRLPKKCVACSTTERLEYHHMTRLHRSARKVQLSQSKTIGPYKYGLDVGSNIIPLCHDCHAVADRIFACENPKGVSYDRERAKELHNRRAGVERRIREFKERAKDKPLFIF